MFFKRLSVFILCMQLSALQALVVQTSDGETVELSADDIQALHSGFIKGYLDSFGEFAGEILQLPATTDTLTRLLGLARKDPDALLGATYDSLGKKRYFFLSAKTIAELVLAVDQLVMPHDILLPLLERQHVRGLIEVKTALKEYGYFSEQLLSWLSNIISRKLKRLKRPITEYPKPLTEEEQEKLA